VCQVRTGAAVDTQELALELRGVLGRRPPTPGRLACAVELPKCRAGNKRRRSGMTLDRVAPDLEGICPLEDDSVLHAPKHCPGSPHPIPPYPGFWKGNKSF
jgi:hypothetical protein